MKRDPDNHTKQSCPATQQTSTSTTKFHKMQASSRFALDLAAFYKFKYDMVRTFNKVQILSKTDCIQGYRPLQAQRVEAREEGVR